VLATNSNTGFLLARKEEWDKKVGKKRVIRGGRCKTQEQEVHNSGLGDDALLYTFVPTDRERDDLQWSPVSRPYIRQSNNYPRSQRTKYKWSRKVDPLRGVRGVNDDPKLPWGCPSSRQKRKQAQRHKDQ
jgi:hypothetical protein